MKIRRLIAMITWFTLPALECRSKTFITSLSVYRLLNRLMFSETPSAVGGHVDVHAVLGGLRGVHVQRVGVVHVDDGAALFHEGCHRCERISGTLGFWIYNFFYVYSTMFFKYAN